MTWSLATRSESAVVAYRPSQVVDWVLARVFQQVFWASPDMLSIRFNQLLLIDRHSLLLTDIVSVLFSFDLHRLGLVDNGT